MHRRRPVVNSAMRLCEASHLTGTSTATAPMPMFRACRTNYSARLKDGLQMIDRAPPMGVAAARKS
jgi:hypothetical protein